MYEISSTQIGEHSCKYRVDFLTKREHTVYRTIPQIDSSLER